MCADAPVDEQSLIADVRSRLLGELRAITTERRKSDEIRLTTILRLYCGLIGAAG